ncbi:hypothetical protein BYT27DRAFT_6894894 [Phlegmacium glaucopus]|nr:hypothetical protein BYT27DRAFT_6894894 [Phlegmacium glaucopus]
MSSSSSVPFYSLVCKALDPRWPNVNHIIKYLIPEFNKFQHKRVAGGTRPKKPVRSLGIGTQYSTFAISTIEALFDLQAFRSPHHSEALKGSQQHSPAFT